MSHIPPQVNFWNLFENGNWSDSGAHFWRDDFLQRYEVICESYSGTVAAHFYGHTHKFSFMAAKNWSAPLFILPAISPIYGNIPSYMVAETDDSTGEILEILQRSFNLTTKVWSTGPPLVDSVFGGQTPLVVSVLQTAAMGLITNSSLWSNFTLVYQGGGTSHIAEFGSAGCDEDCRKLYSCYCRYALWSDVEACAGGALKGHHVFGEIANDGLFGGP